MSIAKRNKHLNNKIINDHEKSQLDFDDSALHGLTSATKNAINQQVSKITYRNEIEKIINKTLSETHKSLSHIQETYLKAGNQLNLNQKNQLDFEHHIKNLPTNKEYFFLRNLKKIEREIKTKNDIYKFAEKFNVTKEEVDQLFIKKLIISNVDHKTLKEKTTLGFVSNLKKNQINFLEHVSKYPTTRDSEFFKALRERYGIDDVELAILEKNGHLFIMSSKEEGWIKSGALASKRAEFQICDKRSLEIQNRLNSNKLSMEVNLDPQQIREFKVNYQEPDAILKHRSSKELGYKLEIEFKDNVTKLLASDLVKGVPADIDRLYEIKASGYKLTQQDKSDLMTFSISKKPEKDLGIYRYNQMKKIINSVDIRELKKTMLTNEEYFALMKLKEHEFSKDFKIDAFIKSNKLKVEIIDYLKEQGVLVFNGPDTNKRTLEEAGIIYTATPDEICFAKEVQELKINKNSLEFNGLMEKFKIDQYKLEKLERYGYLSCLDTIDEEYLKRLYEGEDVKEIIDEYIEKKSIPVVSGEEKKLHTIHLQNLYEKHLQSGKLERVIFSENQTEVPSFKVNYKECEELMKVRSFYQDNKTYIPHKNDTKIQLKASLYGIDSLRPYEQARYFEMFSKGLNLTPQDCADILFVNRNNADISLLGEERGKFITLLSETLKKELGERFVDQLAELQKVLPNNDEYFFISFVRRNEYVLTPEEVERLARSDFNISSDRFEYFAKNKHFEFDRNDGSMSRNERIAKGFINSISKLEHEFLSYVEKHQLNPSSKEFKRAQKTYQISEEKLENFLRTGRLIVISESDLAMFNSGITLKEWTNEDKDVSLYKQIEQCKNNDGFIQKKIHIKTEDIKVKSVKVNYIERGDVLTSRANGSYSLEYNKERNDINIIYKEKIYGQESLTQKEKERSLELLLSKYEMSHQDKSDLMSILLNEKKKIEESENEFNEDIAKKIDTEIENLKNNMISNRMFFHISSLKENEYADEFDIEKYSQMAGFTNEEIEEIFTNKLIVKTDTDLEKEHLEKLGILHRLSEKEAAYLSTVKDKLMYKDGEVFFETLRECKISETEYYKLERSGYINILSKYEFELLERLKEGEEIAIVAEEYRQILQNEDIEKNIYQCEFLLKKMYHNHFIDGDIKHVITREEQVNIPKYKVLYSESVQQMEMRSRSKINENYIPKKNDSKILTKAYYDGIDSLRPHEQSRYFEIISEGKVLTDQDYADLISYEINSSNYEKNNLKNISTLEITLRNSLYGTERYQNILKNYSQILPSNDEYYLLSYLRRNEYNTEITHQSAKNIAILAMGVSSERFEYFAKNKHFEFDRDDGSMSRNERIAKGFISGISFNEKEFLELIHLKQLQKDDPEFKKIQRMQLISDETLNKLEKNNRLLILTPEEVEVVKKANGYNEWINNGGESKKYFIAKKNLEDIQNGKTVFIHTEDMKQKNVVVNYKEKGDLLAMRAFGECKGVLHKEQKDDDIIIKKNLYGIEKLKYSEQERYYELIAKGYDIKRDDILSTDEIFYLKNLNNKKLKVDVTKDIEKIFNDEEISLIEKYIEFTDDGFFIKKDISVPKENISSVMDIVTRMHDYDIFEKIIRDGYSSKIFSYDFDSGKSFIDNEWTITRERVEYLKEIGRIKIETGDDGQDIVKTNWKEPEEYENIREYMINQKNEYSHDRLEIFKQKYSLNDDKRRKDVFEYIESKFGKINDPTGLIIDDKVTPKSESLAKLKMMDYGIYIKTNSGLNLTTKENERLRELKILGYDPRLKHNKERYITPHKGFSMLSVQNKEFNKFFVSKYNVNPEYVKFINTFKQVKETDLIAIGMTHEQIKRLTDGIHCEMLRMSETGKKIRILNENSTVDDNGKVIKYYSLQHEGNVSGRSIMETYYPETPIAKKIQSREDLIVHDLNVVTSVLETIKYYEKNYPEWKVKEIKNESTQYAENKKGLQNHERNGGPSFMDAIITFETNENAILQGGGGSSTVNVAVEYGNYGTARMASKLNGSNFDHAMVFANEKYIQTYEKKITQNINVTYRSI